jgi:Zn-finger nucleic acid-binding protein
VSEAGVYRCPSCGAPADPKSSACEFCRAALQPVRCPWCFAWGDARGGGCPRCGAAPVSPKDAHPLKCPTCREDALFTRGVGGASLSGCAECGGVWADADSFKMICENRAVQAAYMGPGSALPEPKTSDPTEGGIHYRPCAVCGELMNRFNFAGCSGVVLDVCKPHGVWFDVDELRRIVAFIRDGGLDVAREKEIRDLELERGRVNAIAEDGFLSVGDDPSHGPRHIVSASALLAHVLGLEK